MSVIEQNPTTETTTLVERKQGDNNMANIIVASLISGSLFGAALMSAGVYSPHIIIGQMKMENFHMLKAFLAASASSAIAIYTFRKVTTNKCNPRTPSTLGLLGAYDGNAIGGALLGTGMALTGACPGTLLPQLAVGVPTGRYVLVGGLIGGIIYSKMRNQIHAACGLPSYATTTDPTVYQRFGVTEKTGVVGFVAMCFSVIAATTIFFPEHGKILLPAAVGGLFIGLSQATSLVLTGNTLGVSSAYEQFGDLFWWAISFGSSQRPNAKAVPFPLGSVIGAWILSKLIEIPAPVAIDVSPLKAVLGGMLLIIGGRLGGGCTSGHGISGMSMLSISSIVSVASMFGAGILVSLLMG